MFTELRIQSTVYSVTFKGIKIIKLTIIHYQAVMIVRPVDLANRDTWPSFADNPRIHTTFRQLIRV